MASAKLMNSTTSSLRSPPSTLATKDCGRFNRFATTAWVSPALRRAEINKPQNNPLSGKCSDLVSPRAFFPIRRENLIPDSDYPKIGLILDNSHLVGGQG